MTPIPIAGHEAPKPLAFYSPGVVAGEVAYLAGQIASDYRTGVPREARSVPDARGSDIHAQVRYVLGNLQAVARAAGADVAHAVRANVFLKDAADRAGLDEEWTRYFGPEAPPRTVSFVGGHGLLVPGTVVEIDLWAAPAGHALPGIVATTADPVVPRDVARRLGSLVHCAARSATNPDGSVVPSARVRPEFPFYAEPVERQTREVLEQFRALAESWGGRLEDVVWGRAFLTDLRDADLFDEVWQEFMPHGPARSILHSDSLPARDARVQVELIVVAPDARHLVRTVDAPWAPAGCAGAVVVDDVVLLSSVTGTGSDASRGSSALKHEVTAQTEVIVARLDETLRAAGTDLDHLVKTQVFLTDLELFHRYDRRWKRALDVLPPRTTTQAGAQGLLERDALLCVDAVAVLP